MIALLLIAAALAAEPIDLDAALDLAWERAADVRGATLDRDGAEVSAHTRSRAWQPDLTVRAGADGTVGRTFSQDEGTLVTDPLATLGLSATSTMDLWAGGEHRARLRASRSRLAAAAGYLARTREDVAWTVVGAMLSLGQARAEREVAEAFLASAEALEDRIAAYVADGVRTRADLARQRAAVAESRVAVLDARQAGDSAELELVALLRLDPLGEHEFEPPHVAPAPGGDLDLRTLAQRAWTGRADLVALEARLEAAEADQGAAAARRWPSLDLSAGVSTAWSSASEDDLAAQLDERARAFAGVGLAVPIFDRSVIRDGVALARLDQERAALELSVARDAVALDVRWVLLELRSAEAARDAAEVRQEASREALAVTEERYDAGAAALVELIDARRGAVEAGSALVVARSRVLAARYELAWVLGTWPG